MIEQIYNSLANVFNRQKEADTDSIDPKLFAEAIAGAKAQIGNVNILMAGKTGVGKSTLINEVFEGNHAATGQGRPVTMETREISKEGSPLRIVDTRGLEIGRSDEVIAGLEKHIRERAADKDPNRHIHVAWLCVLEDSRRVEDAEIKLMKMLHDAGVKTLVVITKARNDSGFRNELQRIIPEAANVMRVRALTEKLDGGHELPPMGLVELVDATMEIVPEAHKNAFAAAQKVDWKLRSARAQKVVIAAASASAGVAAIPIPYADVAAILPIEVTMLAAINGIFGLSMERQYLWTLVTISLSTGAGAFGRKQVVAELLKFIPGAGSVAGGVLSAVAAAAFTATFGTAYVHAVEHLLSQKPCGDISPEEIASEFKSALSRAS